MRIAIIPGLLIFLVQTALSQSSPEHNKKHKSFMAGEELNYALRYGFIHGGEASVVLDMVDYMNRKVFHSRVLAQTTGIAEKLFSVKDIYESYFDTNTSLPYKAIRNIKEGNYTFYNEVFYNHTDCTLYSQRSDSVFRVPPGILDMVSTLYYIRGVDLEKFKPGEAIEVVTFFGDEIFPFKIRYTGQETIKSKFGKIKCFRFDPVVEPGRIFKSENDMTLWISADGNLIPVLVKFDMWVGSVKVELEGYSRLKYELIFEK